MINEYDFSKIISDVFSSPIMIGMAIGIIVLTLIIVILMLVSFAKIFKKAGKPGWAILIPIYNIIVMIQVAELSLVYFLLLFVPIANIYAIFKIYINIAKRFGKPVSYAIGMIFVPIIFIPLLAFSDNTVNTNENSNTEYDNSNLNNSDSVVSPINLETPTNPVSNVSVDNVSTVPVIDNTLEQENAVQTDPTINNGELSQESVQVDPIVTNSFEPQSTAQTESVSNVNVDNISTEPIIDNTIEPLSTVQADPVINNDELSQNTVSNAFNISPIDYNNTDNNLDNSKKLCKNCGTEMPKIVSVCPNCGTENE